MHSSSRPGCSYSIEHSEMALFKNYPEFILVEVESLKKLLRVGEVYGRLQLYKTKGTDVCEERISINFE